MKFYAAGSLSRPLQGNYAWVTETTLHSSVRRIPKLVQSKQNMVRGYEQFTGHTLEQYFQALVMENGQYTMVGNWWDRKGENEIDLIALNEFDHSGIVAEVKRNPNKISISDLQRKVENLPASEFRRYKLELRALSMDDMW